MTNPNFEKITGKAIYSREQRINILANGLSNIEIDITSEKQFKNTMQSLVAEVSMKIGAKDVIPKISIRNIWDRITQAIAVMCLFYRLNKEITQLLLDAKIELEDKNRYVDPRTASIDLETATYRVYQDVLREMGFYSY